MHVDAHNKAQWALSFCFYIVQWMEMCLSFRLKLKLGDGSSAGG